eukprot:TRINITY_DN3025_c0_g1_i4.p1 TRINITY_DN3025_c0_g1~~TRINITY_DN3025_c0_g1_i4.p1  ORF type:complete len:173 (+),score=9.93 TRINITY_DN3025_c0_g1_i4:351-869(+)
MQGTIPTTINQLTNLKILNLANNNLTGTIPNLDALTKLRNLELSGNLLAGALPSLANLKNLEIALFYDNKLAGTLSFYPLLRLRVLDIGLNSISGKFPMEYYDLPSIEYIGLAGNTQMTSIPLPCVAYPLCFKAIATNVVDADTMNSDLSDAAKAALEKQAEFVPDEWYSDL